MPKLCPKLQPLSGRSLYRGSASTGINPASLLGPLGGWLTVMEYRRLGSSGLTVSRIALGCMSFGDVSRGFSEWSLGDEDAEPFFQQAWS
jgi:hypothetical protein